MSVREVIAMWPTLIIGSVLGLMIVPLLDVGMDGIRGTYDERNPVLVTTGTLVGKREDWIDVAIVGTKKRDCIYVALSAFAKGRDGLIRDTFMLRADRPTSNATRPLGDQTFGTWRIWPTADATRVQVWATHQCEGRLVRTQMADVDIPEEK